MTEHTPGPWEYRDVPGAGLQIWANVALGEDDRCSGLQPIYVVHVRPQLTVGNDNKAHVMISYEDWRQFATVDFEKMQSANARLIAQAPDMLKAIQGALAIWPLWRPPDDVSEEHEDEACALLTMAEEFRAAIAPLDTAADSSRM